MGPQPEQEAPMEEVERTWRIREKYWLLCSASKIVFSRKIKKCKYKGVVLACCKVINPSFVVLLTN